MKKLKKFISRKIINLNSNFFFAYNYKFKNNNFFQDKGNSFGFSKTTH